MVCCTALLTERGVATMWMGLLGTAAQQPRSELILSVVATGLTAWNTARLDSSVGGYGGIGSPNQCDMPQSHSIRGVACCIFDMTCYLICYYYSSARESYHGLNSASAQVHTGIVHQCVSYESDVRIY